MLVMVEKGIRGGICYPIYWYAEASNKHMKDWDKNKESSYIQYWMKITYMVGQCHKGFQ